MVMITMVVAKEKVGSPRAGVVVVVVDGVVTAGMVTAGMAVGKAAKEASPRARGNQSGVGE